MGADNSNPPVLTMISPACGSAGPLALCRRALADSTVPVAPVIVVDDRSTDASSAVAGHCGATVARLGHGIEIGASMQVRHWNRWTVEPTSSCMKGRSTDFPAAKAASRWPPQASDRGRRSMCAEWWA